MVHQQEGHNRQTVRVRAPVQHVRDSGSVSALRHRQTGATAASSAGMCRVCASSATWQPASTGHEGRQPPGGVRDSQLAATPGGQHPPETVPASRQPAPLPRHPATPPGALVSRECHL